MSGGFLPNLHNFCRRVSYSGNDRFQIWMKQPIVAKPMSSMGTQSSTMNSSKPSKPPKPMRKTRTACETCRRRKTKCSGDRPYCQRYQQSHLRQRREHKQYCRNGHRLFWDDETTSHASSSPISTGSQYSWSSDNSSEFISSGDELPIVAKDLTEYEASSITPLSLAQTTYLCKTFFDSLGSIFPFLDSQTFIRGIRSGRTAEMPIHVVCAISSMEISSSPSQVSEDNHSYHIQELDAKIKSRGYMEVVRRLIFKSINRPTKSLIQACVLSAYAEFALENCSAARIYLDLATQGLNQICDQLTHTPVTSHSASSWIDNMEIGEIPVESKGQDSTESFTTSQRNKNASEFVNTDEMKALYDAIDFVAQAIPFKTAMALPHVAGQGHWESLIAVGHVLTTGSMEPYPLLISMIRLHGHLVDTIRKTKAANQVNKDDKESFAFHRHCLLKLEDSLAPELRFTPENIELHMQNQCDVSFLLLHLWLHANIIVAHRPSFRQPTKEGSNAFSQDNLDVCHSSAVSIVGIVETTQRLDEKLINNLAFASKPLFTACCVFMAEGLRSSLKAQKRYSALPMEWSSQLAQEENGSTDINALSAKKGFHLCYTMLQNICARSKSCSHLLQILTPPDEN